MKIDAAAALALALVAARAGAQERDSEPPAPAARAADAGAFIPGSPVPGGAAAATEVALVRFDGARGASRFESVGELEVWGPVALRIGASLGDGGGAPTAAARVRFLDEARHGVAAAVSLGYEGAGFEGRPELVVAVQAARHLGATAVFAELAIGEELGDAQRHGDGRLAALRRISAAAQLGLDASLRVDLDRGRDDGVRDIDFDGLAGALAIVTLGRWALVAEAGASALRFKSEAARTGLLLVGGLGSTF